MRVIGKSCSEHPRCHAMYAVYTVKVLTVTINIFVCCLLCLIRVCLLLMFYMLINYETSQVEKTSKTLTANKTHWQPVY